MSGYRQRAWERTLPTWMFWVTAPAFSTYSPLSFDQNLNPLEDRLGKSESFALEAHQIFTGSPWRVDLEYESWNFYRPTGLPASLGGSQNHVDFRTSIGSLSVGRTLGEDVLLTVGYQQARMKGHYDPFGVYNPHAVASGSVDFENRDLTQHIPFLRTDWKIAPNTDLGVQYRHFMTTDGVNPAIGAGVVGGPNTLAHPFEWQGYQLSTELSVQF